ncbi:MAG: hypothetical protein ACR2PT_09700 [Endozoicomonas sp.]
MKKSFSASLLIFLPLTVLGGSPVHPLCFEPFTNLSSENAQKSINLTACQKQHADQPFTQKTPWQGTFEAAETASIETPKLAQYDIIGQLQDQMVLVNYKAKYGGTGTFSYGFLLEGLSLDSRPHSKQLSHRLSLGGGDRCFEGIEEMAVIAPDKVAITQAITPAPLVNLGRDKPKPELEEGLPGCAICCVGSYTRHVDLQGKSELAELTINTKTLATYDSPQTKCLNRLLGANNNTVKLDPKTLEALQTSYQEQCVSEKNASEPTRKAPS